MEKLRGYYEAEIKSMQKQIESLRNQAESSKLAKDLKTQDPQKNPASKVGTGAKPITKKSSKGCCGGESKCNII